MHVSTKLSHELENISTVSDILSSPKGAGNTVADLIFIILSTVPEDNNVPIVFDLVHMQKN